MSGVMRFGRFVNFILITGLVATLLASCGPAVTTSTTIPTSTTTSTPATTPSSATTLQPTPIRTLPSTTTSPTTTSSSQPTAPGIQVIPEQLKGFSIAGQQCHFLVTFINVSPSPADPVKISAKAAGAQITVYNEAMKNGKIAEVVVVPKPSSVGKTLTVNFTGQCGGQAYKKVISFDVIEGEDDRKAYAQELQARFIAYLEAEHPELGITRQTQWSGTMVSPQWLIVSHYLFFSDEWEMHIQWHIMVPPSDWARIDLRRRYTEEKPSAAFEISSVAGKSTPIPMEIPEEIWR